MPLTLKDVEHAKALKRNNRTDPNTSVGVWFSWLLEHGEELVELAEKHLRKSKSD